MKPYGRQRGDTTKRELKRVSHWDDLMGADADKGRERLRIRLELQKALGPVPHSLTAKDGPPCTCEDCLHDPQFAAVVRELENDEHSHLDAIL